MKVNQQLNGYRRLKKMVKFRSWNEEIKKFNYFENGKYYYFTTNLRGNKVIKIDCEERIEDSNFSWQSWKF